MALCDEGLGSASLHVLPGRDRIDNIEVVVDPAAPLEVLVTGVDGMPLPEALVWAEPRFEPYEPGARYSGHTHSGPFGRRGDVSAIFSGRTDAHGCLAFARLPLPGPYDIVAWAAGHTKAWQDDVPAERDRRRRVTLRLERTRLCTVSGVVHGEDDAPVGGALIETWSGASLRADSAGRFRIEGLDPSSAKVQLTVRAEGYATLRYRNVLLRAGGDVECVELRLERPMPVEGRVVDARGLPIAGVRLNLVRQGQHVHCEGDRTGESGRFLFPDATAGEWELWAIPPRDKDVRWEIRQQYVHGGDRVDLVLRTLRTGSTRLVARVIDATTSQLLDPAQAMLLRTGTRRGAPYESPKPKRQSGAVTAEGLHPGPWRLWVQVPGYAPGYVDFEVAGEQSEARHEVRMGRAGRIVGRLVGAGAGTVVWTLPSGVQATPGSEFEADGLLRAAAKVADDGSFVIERVAPGPTRVWFEDPLLLGEATVEVRPGVDAQIEITARPAARLRFDSMDPVPPLTDLIECYVATAETDWVCVGRSRAEVGRRLAFEHALAAGLIRWRVVFDGDSRVRAQEGVVDLAAGETTVATVPIMVDR